MASSPNKIATTPRNTTQPHLDDNPSSAFSDSMVQPPTYLEPGVGGDLFTEVAPVRSSRLPSQLGNDTTDFSQDCLQLRQRRPTCDDESGAGDEELTAAHQAVGGDAQPYRLTDCCQETTSPSRLATNETPPSWEMTMASPRGC